MDQASIAGERLEVAPGGGDIISNASWDGFERELEYRIGPGDVLVGHRACLGHGGGHTTWTCRTYDQTVYGPPLNTHCTRLERAATVRSRLSETR